MFSSTLPKPAKVLKPQSVPAINCSRSTTFENCINLFFTTSGCSIKFVVESMTPGAIILSLGTLIFSKAFENIKVPKDKIIAPGVIDSTTNFIEHPEVVKNRLIQFSKVVDREQLMAGTDCGFSTFAGFGNVDENIVYKKLESLVIGADLASKII